MNNRHRKNKKPFIEESVLEKTQFPDFDFLRGYRSSIQEPEWPHSIKLQRLVNDLHLSEKLPPLNLPPKSVEECRRLKSTMLTFSLKQQLKSVLLVSILPEEGCSTVLFNLSKTIVLTGPEKILVVDANLRQPVMHEFFQLDLEDGLTELVQRKIGLSRALKKTEFPNLFVLTSGRQYSHPSQILESDSFKEIVKVLELEFDHILFDCAPLSSCSDGIFLSKLVDGVILVIQAHRTRWEVAKQAKQELLRNEANILGVVLNRKKYVIPNWLYKKLN